MIDNNGDSTPTRLLKKRLVLLWASTCAGRILYMLEPSSNLTLRPLLELAFFAFLLAISVVEILILKTAAADYKDSIQPLRLFESSEAAKSPAVYPLSSKLIMGIFMFCLISVLWDTRNDNQMILPMVLGVAMNLWWVWMFAVPRISQKKPSNR
jgi:uncharacterized protein involved in response to NO